MSDLANRLRAMGVSEQRLFNIGLARRAPEVTAKATDQELELAHTYADHKANGRAFEAAKLRANQPRALARGTEALSAIDTWLESADIARKHNQK